MYGLTLPKKNHIGSANQKHMYLSLSTGRHLLCVHFTTNRNWKFTHCCEQAKNTTDNVVINSHAQDTTTHQPTVCIHNRLTVPLATVPTLPRSQLFL